MKKIVMSLAVIATTVSLSAVEVDTPTAVPAAESSALLAGGTVNGQVKVMHILHDKQNTFAPAEGSGYLGTLGYTTKDLGIKGLKANATFYVNGDTGLTNWENDKKDAQGMFTDVAGKTNTLLGQAYLEYKSTMLDAKVGRQILNTPLTKIQWSLMPNFYEAAVATVKPIKSLSITGLHIDKMAYGSRTVTDWSLIGEKTGTAGVTTGAIGQGLTATREQARFLNLGSAAGVGEETSGMSALNVTYKAGKNFKISLWDYIAHDISNTIYADASYSMPVMKGTKLSLEAQYLRQTESGDKLAEEINFNMYGAKAKVGNKKWSAYVAFNQSNDNDNGGQFFNAFGADPAYTSSIFSRNAYRQDVTAYKIGGHYTIMKGLKIKASHADYGQSKTQGWGTLDSVTDATETDIVLVYKPTKAWMLKIFNAIRTSEYNSAAVPREQNHVRAIACYTF